MSPRLRRVLDPRDPEYDDGPEPCACDDGPDEPHDDVPDPFGLDSRYDGPRNYCPPGEH